MNINELMIGDWVCVYSNDRTETHPFRVNEIVERGVYDSHKWFVEEKDIEPIPITPEFLLKNGFIIDDYVPVNKFWMLKNDENVNGSIIFTHKIMDSGYPVDKRSGYCIGPLGMVDLKNMLYVHEMQHGLRVVGNNKELVV